MSLLKVEQYDRLSERVYLSQPKDASAPETILLLCLFFHSPPKLVTRYATDYRTRFPKATIILILSDWKAFFTNAMGPIRDLEPAVDYMVGHKSAKVRGAIYSNGGASSLLSLARLIKARTSSTLKVESMILDSTPAVEDDYASHAKGVQPLVPTALRAFPFGIIFNSLPWIFMVVGLMILKALGKRDPIGVIRTELNDRAILAPSGKRTFIYSRADEITRYTGVESSATDAKDKGWAVDLVEFKGTKHVAHVVGDKERYWRTVEETLK